MRALVTGGTGFIGGRVVDALLRHGYEVTALVRSPERAAHLRERGVTLAPGDVTDLDSVRRAVEGQDSICHVAAYYQLGVREREPMFSINVGGTENVMKAAQDAGTPKIVYCSSQAVLGNGPLGSVGDETREHHGDFSGTYEESKWRAHQIVNQYGDKGLPVVTVMPCAVYGPGDISFLAVLLGLYARKHLYVCSFRDSAVSWVHVDDVAEGITGALEGGTACEEYILGGDNATIKELLDRIAPITGIKPPRYWVSPRMMDALMPLCGVASRMLGQPKDAMKDGCRMLQGSLAFSSEKASMGFGYTFRSVEEGMPPIIETLKR